MFASDIVLDKAEDLSNGMSVAYIDGVKVDIEYDGDSKTCWMADDSQRMPINPSDVMIEFL